MKQTQEELFKSTNGISYFQEKKQIKRKVKAELAETKLPFKSI